VVRARAAFCRRRRGIQLCLDSQLAVTLFRVGLHGNARSVDAAADLFCVSVGGVVKSPRRVGNALARVAPQHILWPSTQRRADSSAYAAENLGIDTFIGAMEGTMLPLAYQPALHPLAYYDRRQRYS